MSFDKYMNKLGKETMEFKSGKKSFAEITKESAKLADVIKSYLETVKITDSNDMVAFISSALMNLFQKDNTVSNSTTKLIMQLEFIRTLSCKFIQPSQEEMMHELEKMIIGFMLRHNINNLNEIWYFLSAVIIIICEVYGVKDVNSGLKGFTDSFRTALKSYRENKKKENK